MQNSIIKCLIERRSSSRIGPPSPTADHLKQIFSVALTVPDHGSLKPYRFVVIEGKRRQVFADGMISATAELKGELPDTMQRKITAKAFVAPMQIAIIFSPHIGHKVPEWEQQTTAACTGYAISVAADALGYRTIWKTFGAGAGSELRRLFGMKPEEQLLGWINIGSPDDMNLAARGESNVENYVTYL